MISLLNTPVSRCRREDTGPPHRLLGETMIQQVVPPNPPEDISLCGQFHTSPRARDGRYLLGSKCRDNFHTQSDGVWTQVSGPLRVFWKRFVSRSTKKKHSNLVKSGQFYHRIANPRVYCFKTVKLLIADFLHQKPSRAPRFDHADDHRKERRKNHQIPVRTLAAHH